MSMNKTPSLYTKPRIWLLVIILLVASVLAIVIPLALLHRYQQNTGDPNGTAGTGPQSFGVGTYAVLSIKEQSGNVSVYPSNSHTITITPRNHGTLVAPDVQNVRILYTHTYDAQGNDQLSVTTDPWFSNTDFYVTLPETTGIQITLNAGSIDVHTGHSLTASTGSGSIDLDSIWGPVNVHTDSGDVTGDNLKGSLTISALSGSLKLQAVSGQVYAKTWSGDVIVSASALAGNSFLQTQNGSVRFDGSIDPHGSSTMQTTNGDVDLALPANSAFVLEASTGSGSVQNAFGGNLVGNTPRAQLSLHTQNGSIAVVKAA